MNLSTPIEKTPRVGSQYQKKLNRLGIQTVSDLLFHFPHRYEDFSNLTPIAEVKAEEKVCIQGKVLDIQNIRTRKRGFILTKATIEDKSGTIKIIWFNRPYLTETLKPGILVCLAGKAGLNKKYFPGIYLSSPAYEKIS